MSKAKTPTKVIAMMQYQQNMLRHVDEQIEQAKDNVDKYYWVGLASGINFILEEALRQHNCYHGYTYQCRNVVVLDNGQEFRPMCGTEHPEFEEWRREYVIKV